MCNKRIIRLLLFKGNINVPLMIWSWLKVKGQQHLTSMWNPKVHHLHFNDSYYKIEATFPQSTINICLLMQMLQVLQYVQVFVHLKKSAVEILRQVIFLFLVCVDSILADVYINTHTHTPGPCQHCEAGRKQCCRKSSWPHGKSQMWTKFRKPIINIQVLIKHFSDFDEQ